MLDIGDVGPGHTGTVTFELRNFIDGNREVLLSSDTPEFVPEDDRINLGRGTTTLRIDFKPVRGGDYSGALTVTAGGVSQTVRVQGTSSVLATRTDSLDFETVVPGMAAARIITLQNRATSPRTVDRSTSGDPFAAVRPSVVVPPDTSVDIAVQFAPAAPGTYSGTLTLTTEDMTRTVTLVGLSDFVPVAELDPTTSDRTLQQPLTSFWGADIAPIPFDTLHIENLGAGALNWSIQSAPPAWLAVTPTTGSIQPRASAELVLAAVPRFVVINAHYAYDLTITSNVPTTPHVIPIDLTVWPILPLVNNGFIADQAWADYDRDGDLDLAVTGPVNDSYFTSLFPNEGASEFRGIGLILPVRKDGHLFWSDFDRNGTPDLAISGKDVEGDPVTLIRYSDDQTVRLETTEPLQAIAGGPFAHESTFRIGPPITELTEAALHANYPNPFHSETTIPFDVPEATHARLSVFDLLGRRVAVLVDAPVDAGAHIAQWSAAGMAAGLYVVRLEAGTFTTHHTMVVVR